MATAGKILILPKGAWDETLNYRNLDLVSHNNKIWLAKKGVVGIEPNEDNVDYWMEFAKLPIADNLTTTETGSALDARQGAILLDMINLTDEAVATLKTRADQTDENVTALTERVYTAEADIVALKETTDTATEDISALKEKVADTFVSNGDVQTLNGNSLDTVAEKATDLEANLESTNTALGGCIVDAELSDTLPSLGTGGGLGNNDIFDVTKEVNHYLILTKEDGTQIFNPSTHNHNALEIRLPQMEVDTDNGMLGLTSSVGGAVYMTLDEVQEHIMNTLSNILLRLIALENA